ncbi:MAG: hypothetical protein ACREAG_08800 [Nitrosopumilaceae archaeon]
MTQRPAMEMDSLGVETTIIYGTVLNTTSNGSKQDKISRKKYSSN